MVDRWWWWMALAEPVCQNEFAGARDQASQSPDRKKDCPRTRQFRLPAGFDAWLPGLRASALNISGLLSMNVIMGPATS
jgi:hypothetical protein